MRDVLLIQADGPLPNVALMKIARYHRNLGDHLDLQHGMTISSQLVPHDIVYISCIFSKNKDKALALSAQFPGADVHLGGSGVDLKTPLPDEIEHLMPLYDDPFKCEYSIGFTTRGCIRHCEFCIVPEKEGHIRVVAEDIHEFWDRRHKHVVLCDNNILALPDHFNKIATQLKDNKLSVDFNQGLDIRLLTDDIAKTLKSLRVKPELRFSWDNIHDEEIVAKGIETLKRAGIKRSMFFVLSGFNSTFEEDQFRLDKLRSWDQDAYVMRYETVQHKCKYILLASWANQHHIFRKMPFDEYVRRKQGGKTLEEWCKGRE